MKFKNSPVYNKQHFIAVACILAVLSVGVILVAVSNESCNQGFSAEETLRRRLGSSEELPEHDNWFYKKDGYQQLLDRDNIGFEEDGSAQSEPPKDNVETNKVIKCLKKKGLVYAAGILIPTSWAIFVGAIFSLQSKAVQEGSSTELNFSGGACGVGFITTLLVMYVYLALLSRHGKLISEHFGAAGNSFIILSQVCLFSTGASLSFTRVCPEAMHAFGMLAIGALFTCLFFKFLKPTPRDNPTFIYSLIGVLSVLTTTSAGLMIFGAHNPPPPPSSPDSPEVANLVLQTGGWIFVIALLSAGFLYARNAGYYCGKGDAEK